VGILDVVWTAVFELVESHFKQNLEDSVLADASCWDNLRNSEHIQRPTKIPIPQSNSPAARAMRIAAVLALVSRTLHKYIFRPLYIIDGDEELTAMLREAEKDNAVREMHTRATLLAMLPTRQHDSAKRRVHHVVREVSWVVQHLLSALAYEAFCTRLGQVCALACTQWRRIQEARMKIEPYFGPPYDEFDWQKLPLAEFDEGWPATNGAATPPESSDTAVEEPEAAEPVQDAEAPEKDPDAAGSAPDDAADVAVDELSEPGAETEGESELEPDEILLVVWPSMCVVEGGEFASITQGIVVSKDQARRALDEVRALQGPRPNIKKARTSTCLSLVRHGGDVGPALPPPFPHRWGSRRMGNPAPTERRLTGLETVSIPSHSRNGSPVPAKAFLAPADASGGDGSGAG